MSNELLRWRKGATGAEWSMLATLANTTTGYLDQIAYGNRRASPEKAKAIEDASQNFNNQPPITKESLVFAESKNSAA